MTEHNGGKNHTGPLQSTNMWRDVEPLRTRQYLTSLDVTPPAFGTLRTSADASSQLVTDRRWKSSCPCRGTKNRAPSSKAPVVHVRIRCRIPVKLRTNSAYLPQMLKRPFICGDRSCARCVRSVRKHLLRLCVHQHREPTSQQTARCHSKKLASS